MDMIQSTGAPAAIGPYSQAVDTGSTVYLSGQIGQDPASGQIVTGFKAQTIQALENLKAVLAAAGMTLDNMAQVDVFVTDMRNFEDFNAIYSPTSPPTSRHGCSSRSGGSAREQMSRSAVSHAGGDPAGMRPACPGTVPHNSVSRTGSFSPPSGRARAGSMDFGPVLAY